MDLLHQGTEMPNPMRFSINLAADDDGFSLDEEGTAPAQRSAPSARLPLGSSRHPAAAAAPENPLLSEGHGRVTPKKGAAAAAAAAGRRSPARRPGGPAPAAAAGAAGGAERLRQGAVRVRTGVRLNSRSNRRQNEEAERNNKYLKYANDPKVTQNWATAGSFLEARPPDLERLLEQARKDLACKERDDEGAGVSEGNKGGGEGGRVQGYARLQRRRPGRRRRGSGQGKGRGGGPAGAAAAAAAARGGGGEGPAPPGAPRPRLAPQRSSSSSQRSMFGQPLRRVASHMQSMGLVKRVVHPGDVFMRPAKRPGEEQEGVAPFFRVDHVDTLRRLAFSEQGHQIPWEELCNPRIYVHVLNSCYVHPEEVEKAEDCLVFGSGTNSKDGSFAISSLGFGNDILESARLSVSSEVSLSARSTLMEGAELPGQDTLLKHFGGKGAEAKQGFYERYRSRNGCYAEVDAQRTAAVAAAKRQAATLDPITGLPITARGPEQSFLSGSVSLPALCVGQSPSRVPPAAAPPDAAGAASLRLGSQAASPYYPIAAGRPGTAETLYTTYAGLPGGAAARPEGGAAAAAAAARAGGGGAPLPPRPVFCALGDPRWPALDLRGKLTSEGAGGLPGQRVQAVAAALSALPARLRGLDISGNGLATTGVVTLLEAVARAGHPLEVLLLGGNHLGARGAKAISELLSTTTPPKASVSTAVAVRFSEHAGSLLNEEEQEEGRYHNISGEQEVSCPHRAEEENERGNDYPQLHSASLRALGLSNTELGDRGVAALCKALLRASAAAPGLEALDLSRCRLTPRGVAGPGPGGRPAAAAAAAPRGGLGPLLGAAGRLRRLDLSWNDLGARGAVAVCAALAGAAPPLLALDLSFAGIRARGPRRRRRASGGAPTAAPPAPRPSGGGGGGGGDQEEEVLPALAALASACPGLAHLGLAYNRFDDESTMNLQALSTEVRPVQLLTTAIEDDGCGVATSGTISFTSKIAVGNSDCRRQKVLKIIDIQMISNSLPIDLDPSSPVVGFEGSTSLRIYMEGNTIPSTQKLKDEHHDHLKATMDAVIRRRRKGK